MKYGYIRPINLNDSINDQKEKLSAYTSEIYIEKHANNKQREQIKKLFFENLSINDELFITDLCILADSTKQLVELIEITNIKNISIHVLNLNIIINKNNKWDFSTMLKYISDFQSDVVKFRTRLGMKHSSNKGTKMGRPKRNDENLRKAIEMYMSKKYTLDEIKEKTNISRATLYRHLDQ